jgi:hypothetical protein
MSWPADRMQSEFGDTLARCAPTRRGGRIAGALFSGASVEAGCSPEKAVCLPSAQGTDGTRLPTFGLHRALPRWSNVSLVCAITRTISTLDAQPGMDSTKAGTAALERNEEEIERWKQESGHAYKNAARLGAHIVFVDESGFLLIPNVVRTWAPQGQTSLRGVWI